MSERRRLPRLEREADFEGAAFLLRAPGGRSAGSARRSPPREPPPRQLRLGSIRSRFLLRPRPNIADPARGGSRPPDRESLGRNAPRRVPERNARGLRAGKAYAGIDEPAK